MDQNQNKCCRSHFTLYYTIQYNIHHTDLYDFICFVFLHHNISYAQARRIMLLIEIQKHIRECDRILFYILWVAL